MPNARTFRATFDVNTPRVGGTVSRKPREGAHAHPAPTALLEQALEIIGLARPLVTSVARRDRDLASQIQRALSSVALNLSEGFGAHAGNARLRFESARGSLYEAHAGIRVAIAWGYMPAADAAAILSAIDRLGRRVFGLCRR